MKKTRQDGSGALIFNPEGSDKKKIKQNKVLIQLEKDVASLSKRFSTLQTKHRALVKKVEKLEKAEK